MSGCQKRTIEAIRDPKEMIDQYLDALSSLWIMRSQHFSVTQDQFEGCVHFIAQSQPYIVPWLQTEVLSPDDLRYLTEKRSVCVLMIQRLTAMLTPDHRHPFQEALKNNIKALERLSLAFQDKLTSSFRAALAEAVAVSESLAAPEPAIIDPIDIWMYGVDYYGDYEEIWKQWTQDDRIVGVLTAESLEALLKNIDSEGSGVEFQDLAIGLYCAIKRTELLTETSVGYLSSVLGTICSELLMLRELENNLIDDFGAFMAHLSSGFSTSDGIDEFMVDFSDLLDHLKDLPTDFTEVERCLDELTVSFNEWLIELPDEMMNAVDERFDLLSSRVQALSDNADGLTHSDCFYFNCLSFQVATLLEKAPRFKSQELGKESLKLLMAQYLYLSTSSKVLHDNDSISIVDVSTGERVVDNRARAMLVRLQSSTSPARATTAVRGVVEEKASDAEAKTSEVEPAADALCP